MYFDHRSENSKPSLETISYMLLLPPVPPGVHFGLDYKKKDLASSCISLSSQNVPLADLLRDYFHHLTTSSHVTFEEVKSHASIGGNERANWLEKVLPPGPVLGGSFRIYFFKILFHLFFSYPFSSFFHFRLLLYHLLSQQPPHWCDDGKTIKKAKPKWTQSVNFPSGNF